MTKKSKDTDDIKIQLHGEKLDITKNKVEKGHVHIYKEVIKEEKIFKIPVVREELVIEKQDYNQDEGEINTIRIPLKEERIEITKDPVILEDISIHNNQFEDIKQVEAILKKEELRIKTSGDAKVIDEQREDT